MKSTRRRALYVIAALLGALFVLSCLVGFAACGGGDGDEDDATVSTVSISGTSSVEVGSTVTLTASVTMSDNSSYTGSYTWSSTGTAVTLSSSTTSTVIVTGVTAGSSSDITVTAGGVTSAKYTVSVTAAAPEEATVTEVKLDKSSLSLSALDGETATLTASVTMSDSSSYSGSYNWSSSDTNSTYVKLTGNGATATVEAVSATTEAVTITVSAGGQSDTCSVTVTDSTVSTVAGLSDALASGGSVSLTDDITLADSSSALEVKADTTIDLAGKTISTGEDWTGSSAYYEPEALITVDSGATLTVTDSGTGTTSGSISYTYTTTEQATNSSNGKTADWNSSAYYGAAIEVEEGGTLVIESGTIESSSVGVRAEGVDSSTENARATVTIEGGTISSTYFSIWASGDADVTISGGTISGTNKGICIGGDSNFGYSSYQSNTKTTLTINGGEVSCTNDSAICTLGVGSNASAEITITGGTITNSAQIVYKTDSTTGEPTNEVETAAPAIYLPTGTLTITGGKIVSENLTAVEVRGGIAKISGGELIGESKATEDSSNKGDDASPDKSGSKTYGYALSVYPYGKVSRSGYQESDNAVNVTVTAGTFDGDIYVAAESENNGSDGNTKWTVALNDENAEETAPYVVTINMSLGFTKKAYASDGNQVCESSSDISYYIFSVTVTEVSTADGLSTALTSGGEIVLTDDITLSDTTTGGDTATALTVSADTEMDLAGKTISTADSLSSALNTIEVSANATLTIIDSTGSGSIANTYTGTDGNTSLDNAAAIESKGTLVIESGTIESTSIGVKAEGGEVTIDGGTIESDYFALWEGGANVEVTINDGTLSGKDKGVVLCGDSNYGYDSYQSGVTTKLTITGGEITCENDSAITTLGVGSNASAEITISGGTITSSATPVIDEDTQEVITSCPAIYLPTGTLTITGGTISGTTAVEVRGGKVNISGGTLVCLSYDEDGNIVQGDDASQSKSGAKTYGYALSVYPYGKVSRTGYTESDNAVDVTVTGGTFEGDIYVAAESQNAGSDGSKWTVDISGNAQANAPYVVTITLEETAYTVTTTAYDATGVIGSEDPESRTPTYYIITVTAVATTG